MAITGFNGYDSRFIDVVYSQTSSGTGGEGSISGTAKKTLHMLKIYTADAGVNFFKVYDSPEPSASTAPVIVLRVEGSGTRSNMTVIMCDGITFTNAISVRITENPTDSDTTSPSHAVGYFAVIS
jgi:hypothetical protein